MIRCVARAYGLIPVVIILNPFVKKNTHNSVFSSQLFRSKKTLEWTLEVEDRAESATVTKCELSSVLHQAQCNTL